VESSSAATAKTAAAVEDAGSAGNEHASSFLERCCAGGRGPRAKPGREKIMSAVELESGAGSARRHVAAARWGSEATVEDNREKGTMAIIAKT
jgi:hypothetical protein